jgi:hypothetical protein
MATSMSLFLIAVGAILAIAVNYQTQGIDINAVGVILMVVGGIGMLFSVLFLASFAPFRMGYTPHDEVPPEHRTHEHY